MTYGVNIIPIKHFQIIMNVIGLMLMALSSFAFSLMSLSVKVASGPGFQFTSFELVFIRSFIQMFGALVFLVYTHRHPFGPKNSRIRWLLVGRGLAGSTGLTLFYYSLSVMSLADATVIFFTGPPFTAVLAYFALKEPISKWDITALVSCLIGVILVARPSFLFHDDESNHGDLPHEIPSINRVFGIISALCGAVISAIAYVTVRQITKLDSTVHAMVHVFSFGWISSCVSLIGMCFQRPRLPATLPDFGILLGVGLSGFIGQIMLNRGLQLSHAGN